MTEVSTEFRNCIDFINRSSDPLPFDRLHFSQEEPLSLVVTQGFEERSTGLLQACLHQGRRVETIIQSCYSNPISHNSRFEARFEQVVREIAPTTHIILNNDDRGDWAQEALHRATTRSVILDISALSQRGLFGVLDRISASDHEVLLGYSEAKEYWPTRDAWRTFKRSLSDRTTLQDRIEEQPWLFGMEHSVELISGHDGYDSGGARRALVGFLPYKRSRLAAVLSQEDYSNFLFVSGRPRLKKNRWRLNALKEINQSLIGDWPVVDLCTFDYRACFSRLSEILLGEVDGGYPLLERFDVHIAVMGSKMQSTACWVMSRIVPAITFVTSVPTQYYPEAFSEGIGRSWLLGLGGWPR